MIFINRAPENDEWTSHIYLLNKWTPPDRQLRHIVQYARSGPHYPADIHVDLIEQYAAKERIDELASVRTRYGQYIAETAKSGEVGRWLTIGERIAVLEAQFKSP